MDERSELTNSPTLKDGLVPSPPHPASRTPSPSLPEIPATDLDLSLSFDSIMGKQSQPEPHVERVQKRASNVLKLTQENEKLREELRAMTARLEAAERRRQEIASRHQQQQQSPLHPSQQSSILADPARSQGDS